MSSDAGADRRVVVGADRDVVVSVVAVRLVALLTELVDRQDAVHLSLTGGGAGIGVLTEVAAHPAAGGLPWERVHFWWSDERFVARDDDERNEKQARAALLDVLPVPPANIHAIAASDEVGSAEDAAAAYADELARFPSAGHDSRLPWPSFDVCLLGVGPDAHIASLFPDRAEIAITDTAAAAVHDSPKPPPVRVTLTRPVINASHRVWLVLTGAEKASALGLALAGASYQSVPAAGAKGRDSTVFFVDVAAAAEVPEDLIDPD